jgi:hypothetical protein
MGREAMNATGAPISGQPRERTFDLVAQTSLTVRLTGRLTVTP